MAKSRTRKTKGSNKSSYKANDSLTQKTNITRKQKLEEDQKSILEQDIDLEVQKNKAEEFIHKNKGLLFGILGAIILLSLLYFGFKSFVGNQESQAQAAMFKAQEYFAQDDYQKALDGDEANPGFLDIINDYSGRTKSSNLANYYAGISYLNLGQFDQAIQYLKNYKGTNSTISAMANGAIGHANMELGNTDEGIGYYKKAANSNNAFTAPLYLLQLGMASEMNQDYKTALDAYQKIEKNYPKSTEARDIQKYITRVSAQL